jgi:hypothetical protein
MRSAHALLKPFLSVSYARAPMVILKRTRAPQVKIESWRDYA